MALLNPSFEDGGALPGQAAHWTLTAVTSREAIAGFGTAPEEAWEDFERWFPLRTSLEEVPVERAFFDAAAEGFEDFEEAWANSSYLFDLLPAQLATCAFGGGTVEDYEGSWNNAPYLRDWQRVPSSSALFSDAPAESFEQQWRNDSYARTWAELIASAARFDAGAQPVEDFENTWTNATTL